ncbi:HAD family hydrolase [Lactiplantibacillus daowaiensis]|uniref:HAD family hydrolase n=1 Tax=Lactiplantibacillus daowaiensis TaxID=2559918 RepID=A0ABW1S1M8_9LACO|nr:HAD family hydrolase [Lactiplantibacillus daowaiensis]
MTYQTILFDIDNTLINSANLIAETLQKGAAAVGVDVPLAEYRKRIGRPGDEILKEFGVPDWQKVLDGYMVEFGRNMHRLAYFPGIEALLLNLNKLGIQTGVVTSKDRLQFDAETKYFPLIAAAEIVTTSDLTANPKPSAEPLLYTVKTHQLDLERTLYIGDSVFDMQAAKAAQMDFASAGWGALPGIDFGSAKYALTRPDDVLKLI